MLGTRMRRRLVEKAPVEDIPVAARKSLRVTSGKTKLTYRMHQSCVMRAWVPFQ